MQKRIDIYKRFKKYVMYKDVRSMDNICISPNTEFQLQAQQNFLKEYMVAYPKWDKLMLYHGIGSGKTCTAITMAEEYLRLNPKNKVNIILPARLKTNFFDELISPCGFDKYISREDFVKYNHSSTKAGVKKAIKAKFMAAIEARYTILSFEKVKLIFKEHKHNIKKWVETFTKDSLLIVDEVHNLISDKYDENAFKDIIDTGKLKKSANGMNTIFLKVLNTFRHGSSKMIYMTATPVFDNILQFKELVKIMVPTAVIPSDARISDVIDHLRGKVSYFPGTSMNAYPAVEYDIHNIKMSKTQDQIINDIILKQDDEGNENKESFMIKQRQASLACLPKNSSIKGQVAKVLSNIHEYSPKIEEMMRIIKSVAGKHVVYSNFVQTGVEVVEQLLVKEGWKNINDVLANETLWEKYKGKVFATWSGNTKDASKQIIKRVANSVDNMHGDKIRVIIGSPSMKEGISFKHIQHMHLLDPVWNQSAKTQVEGRAIRFCSHVDIDEARDMPLKRKVVINIYKLVPRADGLVSFPTSDQAIYDIIIVQKQELIKAAEAALKKVAIDHYLFRNLNLDTRLPSPSSPDIGSAKSAIGLSPSADIYLKNKQPRKKKTSTCPKKRLPPCGLEYFKRQNAHGDDCCYKTHRSKKHA